MTTLFSADFESPNNNFNSWTQLSGTSNGGEVREVIAGAALAGSYGAHFAIANQGSTDSSWVRHQATDDAGRNIFSLRALIQVNSVAGAGAVSFMYLRRVSVATIAYLQYNNGTWQLFVRKLDATTTTVDFSSGLSTGVTYDVEILYDVSGANPVATIIVDGAIQATYTDTSSGTIQRPYDARIHIREEAEGAYGDVYFDNAVVADAQQQTVGGGATVRPRGLLTTGVGC